MSEGPERIWAWESGTERPDCKSGEWCSVPQTGDPPDVHEYRRADLPSPALEVAIRALALATSSLNSDYKIARMASEALAQIAALREKTDAK
jgi:hypothetical protein